MTLKGETLDKRLYVPEPFRVADKEEIGERRRRKLAMLLSPGDDVAYKMAIVIGQFNGAEQSAYGRRLLVKHMPDVPLYMENKAWERAERAYAATLQARDADLERKPMVVMAAATSAITEASPYVTRTSFTLQGEYLRRIESGTGKHHGSPHSGATQCTQHHAKGSVQGHGNADTVVVRQCHGLGCKACVVDHAEVRERDPFGLA